MEKRTGMGYSGKRCLYTTSMMAAWRWTNYWQARGIRKTQKTMKRIELDVIALFKFKPDECWLGFVHAVDTGWCPQGGQWKFKHKAHLGPRAAQSGGRNWLMNSGNCCVTGARSGVGLPPAMDLSCWGWAGQAPSARKTAVPWGRAMLLTWWVCPHSIAMIAAGESGHWPTDPQDHTWHRPDRHSSAPGWVSYLPGMLE